METILFCVLGPGVGLEFKIDFAFVAAPGFSLLTAVGVVEYWIWTTTTRDQTENSPEPSNTSVTLPFDKPVYVTCMCWRLLGGVPFAVVLPMTKSVHHYRRKTYISKYSLVYTAYIYIYIPHTRCSYAIGLCHSLLFRTITRARTLSVSKVVWKTRLCYTVQ